MGVRQVELDPEVAADPHGAVCANAAVHQFHQSFAHHQANTSALFFTFFLAQAVKRLEQLGQLLGRQAFTGVAHADVHTGLAGGPKRHIQGAALAVVFDGIGEQVHKHLLHAGAVCLHKTGRLEVGKAHLYAAPAGLRLYHGLTVAQHLL